MARGEGARRGDGGRGFSDYPDNPLLDDFLLELTGAARPKVCFIGTASGDADSCALKFFEAFATRGCIASRLILFRRPKRPAEELLAEQDLIYVGGGSTANMLAVWRLHGIDLLLREAWKRGAVLGGLSAGAICWFEGGVTDSFGGDQLVPLDGCLALVPGSLCPHYDTEPHRAPTFRSFVGARRLPAGYGVDDGVALHFAGAERVEVVSARPSAGAYWVEASAGSWHEEPLETRLLA